MATRPPDAFPPSIPRNFHGNAPWKTAFPFSARSIDRSAEMENCGGGRTLRLNSGIALLSFLIHLGLMKRITLVCGIVATILVLAITFRLNATVGTGTTRIRLSGVTGTPFTGFYVQAGEERAVSGVLPWELAGTDITAVELKK